MAPVMPFPERLLNEGEAVVIDVRPHVWALAGPVTVTAVVVVAAGAGSALHAPPAVGWVLVGLLALAIVHLLGRYGRWRSTSLVVTGDRLIRRSGVVSKHGHEIPLSQLADISYRQTIFDRLIGAGDLVLESAGHDRGEVLAGLPHPETIQNEIHRLLSARESPAASPRPVSLPEQLEHLADLRRRGVLSESEFASAKTRLLRG